MEIKKGNVHFKCISCESPLVWSKRVGPRPGIRFIKRCPDCFKSNPFALDEYDYDLIMAYRRRKFAELRRTNVFAGEDYDLDNKDVILEDDENKFEREAQEEVKKKYGTRS